MSYTTKKRSAAVTMALIFCLSLIMSSLGMTGLTAYAAGTDINDVKFVLEMPTAGETLPAVKLSWGNVTGGGSTNNGSSYDTTLISVSAVSWEYYDENTSTWKTEDGTKARFSTKYRAAFTISGNNATFLYSPPRYYPTINYYLSTNVSNPEPASGYSVDYNTNSSGDCTSFKITYEYENATDKPSVTGIDSALKDPSDPLGTIPYNTPLSDIFTLAKEKCGVKITTSASSVNPGDELSSFYLAIDWDSVYDSSGNIYNNYESDRTAGKLTNGISIQLRGRVVLPNRINVPTTADWAALGGQYVFLPVTVAAAQQLATPTVLSPTPGNYTSNQAVMLSTAGYPAGTSFYYYIEKSFERKDLKPLIEQYPLEQYPDKWKLYDPSLGIPVQGVPDNWQQVTFAVYAVCTNMMTSEAAYFTYYLDLPAEEFGNIYSAYIEIEPPVAGEPLARTADIDHANNMNRGIEAVESVTWSEETESGRAKYNTRYTVTIILVPDSMHAFYSTPDVFVNGMPATQATNTEGKLIVKYTFDYYTDLAKLTKIFNPAPMTGIANGTPLSDIRAKVYSMYSEIEVITEDARGTLPVTWDFANVDYDVSDPDEQTFYVTGKLNIPADLDIAAGVNNYVELAVTVVSAGTTSAPRPVNWEFSYNYNPEIELVCDDPGSKIYYNIDGGTASPLDTLYSGKKIKLEGIEGQTVTITLNAIATCPGKINSAPVSYTYTIRLPVAAPVPSIIGGHYSSNQSVELTTTTRNAEIYYTTDGTTPSVSNGRRYSETGPIKVECDYGESVTVRIRAVAIVSGMPYSDIMDETYTVTREKGVCEMPYPDVAEGEYNLTSLKVALACDTPGATIRYNYTLDGTNPATPTATSPKYSKAFSINGILGERVTLKIAAVAMKDNMITSGVTKLTYTLYLPINTVPAPVFNLQDAQFTTYTTAQELTISCSDKDAEIFYTSDGITEPTSASKKYSAPLKLSGITGESVTYTIKAIAVKNGMKDSSVQTIKVRIEIPDPGPAVKSISIANKPLKTTYNYGDKLNVAGGRIKVTYTDNTVELLDMTEDMIVWFDSTEIGFQPITVYYKGKRTEFSVVVLDPYADDPTDDSKDDNKDDTKDDTSDDSKDDSKDNPGSSSDSTDELPYIVNTKTRGWDNIENRIRVTEQGTLVPIVLNGATYVPGDVVNTASDREIILQMQVDSAIAWLIDTGAVYGSVANVSVGMKTSNIYIPEVLVNSAGGRESIRFHTYGANKLNAEISIKTGAQKGMFANLYRYNTGSKKLEFIDTAKITNGGYASLTPGFSGDYVVMIDSTTALPGDMNNSTRLDAIDASMILKAIVNRTVGSSLKGDFNGDGKVNALDAGAILHRIVGAM